MREKRNKMRKDCIMRHLELQVGILTWYFGYTWVMFKGILAQGVRKAHMAPKAR